MMVSGVWWLLWHEHWPGMVAVGPATAYCAHCVWVNFLLTLSKLRRVPWVRTRCRVIASAGSEHRGVINVLHSGLQCKDLFKPVTPLKEKAEGRVWCSGSIQSLGALFIQCPSSSSEPVISAEGTLLVMMFLHSHHTAFVTFCCSVFINRDKQEKIVSGRKGDAHERNYRTWLEFFHTIPSLLHWCRHSASPGAPGNTNLPNLLSSETTLFCPTTYSVELQRLEKNFLLQCDDDEPWEGSE